MSAVRFEDLLNEVLPYAPGCSELAALQALRNATIEFCRRTQVWQQDIDPITTVPGIAEYELDVPSGAEVSQVMALYFGRRKLERTAPITLNGLYGFSWQDHLGDPMYFMQLDPNLVVVTPCPDEKVRSALTGRVSLQPTRDATTVDSIVSDRWVEVLAAGALQRLYNTPGETYFSGTAASQKWTAFQSGIATAAAYVTGGGVRAPLRVRFQRKY